RSGGFPYHRPITTPRSSSRTSVGRRSADTGQSKPNEQPREWVTHLDYIHFNPVKHRWVSRVADWAHSSFHHVRSGWYPLEWAAPADVREWALE
ncbi:MAG: hypothetical protein ACREXX_10825, partial [Gammaproteobacteria bacterium]